eukprot:CAMPEP_0181344048 /NCGR_PEP_ID=MMETSP1101-20121128/31951_1 /TAXON_ID=46948 /ORGANISM="Rhodomonas abbreviata, Strain Caron Lab Isolate" /LENGTH=135 /DNA_ID=CAMNT_0023455797 /DNA_START=74 /DNA_END=481 /DNA_ORIENTATION=+
MGTAASFMTHRIDWRKRSLNYDTLQQHIEITGAYTLQRVHYLFLCRNKLSSLPPEIRLMSSLLEFHCTDNWLKRLPEIDCFTRLQTLRVGGNQLVSIENVLPNSKAKAKGERTTEELMGKKNRMREQWQASGFYA